MLTEAWNFAVFESLFDDSDRFILCEEYLDVKSVCLKTICQVRKEIKNILERQVGKAVINSFPSLRPTVRISADPVFDLQSTVIQNNTEIEVTGKSFVHPILTEVPMQDINSELQYIPASDEPIASASNQRRRNHVAENITHDVKVKRINDSNDRQRIKERKLNVQTSYVERKITRNQNFANSQCFVDTRASYPVILLKRFLCMD